MVGGSEARVLASKSFVLSGSAHDEPDGSIPLPQAVLPHTNPRHDVAPPPELEHLRRCMSQAPLISQAIRSP